MAFSLLSNITKKQMIIISAIILLIRYIVLYTNNLNLYADEAQYFFWSQNLDFGYYSKPPIIAYAIALSTYLLGTFEFGVRFFAPIAHFVTAYYIYKIVVYQTGKTENAYFGALCYLTIPALGLSSIIISTDVFLLMFWTMALYFYLNLEREDSLLNTIKLGLVLGLGMLSKYNMSLFWLGGILHLLISKQFKKLFWPCFIASIIAFIIFLPNLLWNYSNNFVSFMHTKDISKLENSGFSILKMLEFVFGQIIVVGPVLAYIIIKNLINNKAIYNPLLIFSLSGILPLVGLSLTSGANVNWGVIAYPGIIALIFSYDLHKLDKLSLAVNVVLNILFIILAHTNFNGFDPFYRTKGWDNYGKIISETYYKNTSENILFDERKLMSWALYYSTLPKHVMFKYAEYYPQIKDHYDLKMAFNESTKGQLIVTKDCFKKYGTLITEFRPLPNVKNSPHICIYKYE